MSVTSSFILHGIVPMHLVKFRVRNECVYACMCVRAMLLKLGLFSFVSDVVRLSDKKAVFQVQILSDLIITIASE